MTNGILSLIRNGRVFLKAVAGCDGYNVDKLAKWVISHFNAYTEVAVWSDQQWRKRFPQICDNHGFGCAECRVIQMQDELGTLDGAALDGLYADPEIFQNARFNPRWACGLSGRLAVVELLYHAARRLTDAEIEARWSLPKGELSE